jgi:hypothetical protein
MKHDEAMRPERYDQVDAPFECGEGLRGGHIFVRSPPVDGKSDQALADPKLPSLLDSDMKAENTLTFKQRVVTVYIEKRLIQIVDPGAYICVKRANANAQSFAVKSGRKFVLG